MTTDSTSTKRKRPVLKIIVLSLLIILTIAGIFLYNNFNQLLSDALIKGFNSNIVSDVYELKFEKLRVNFFERSIRVINVSMLPREKPLRNYPYINGSLELKAEKITLMNVQLFTFLKEKKLRLERISLTKPEIRIVIAGKKPVFFPFKDSTEVDTADVENKKKAMDAFLLQKFQLIDASFHVTNSARERNFTISEINVSLDELKISQQPGVDLLSFKHVDLSVGEFDGRLKKRGIKSIRFKDFKVGIDSLRIKQTVDTVTFHFDDATAGLKELDIQTADSIFHLTMQSFDLSYKDKSIKLKDLSYMSNISDAAMQDRFTHQHTNISGAVGSMHFRQVNFDSLIYSHSLYIDEILVDKPNFAFFKDHTKPVDVNRFPKYFGQQINAIPIRVRINRVKATRIHLTNVERKRDSTLAKVTIERGTANVQNISNLSKTKPLTLIADAHINNKVHFNLRLDFSYEQPQFTMDGKFEKFDLPDLNGVLGAYTPAKINAGVADEITFSGMVYWTNSTGSMKFLYHDLEIDLDLKDMAKWKSSVLAFSANTIVNSSNPRTKELPPRIVQLQATRDMNKGFINLIIRSALNGVKETLMMGKENRKAHHDATVKSKKEKKR